MTERLDVPALSKSLLIHAGVIGLLFFSWNAADEVVTPKGMPQHVTAVVMEKPKAQAPAKSAPQPVKKVEPPKPVKQPEPKKPEPKKPEPKKPEPKKPEPKKPEPKKPDATKPDPRKKPEPQKPQPKKPEPKKPEPKTDSVDFSDILQSEMKQLDKQPKAAPSQPAPTKAPTASAPPSGSEKSEVDEYVSAIQQAISRNWIQPPSARTGMVVTLQINLLPGGELNDVRVIVSSGNDAFDRSAVAAVKKVDRFPVPSDPGLFDRQFRSLKLRFNPDDLRY